MHADGGAACHAAGSSWCVVTHMALLVTPVTSGAVRTGEWLCTAAPGVPTRQAALVLPVVVIGLCRVPDPPACPLTRLSP
jgi:hypothetical protein